MVADSVIPRRFRMVKAAIMKTAIRTRSSCRDGNADVIASVPAEALTATVRM